MLTQEVLKELLHYNPDTGIFTWRYRDRKWFKSDCSCGSWNTKYSRKTTGSIDGKGYLHVGISKRYYRLHRLAFLYMEGSIPRYVDHIDRIRTNNVFNNLRPCNCKGNSGNSGIHAHNTSGYRGVSLNSKSGLWVAQIKIDGKQTYLGRFTTAVEASLVYNKAAKEHFNEFATLN